MKAQNTLLALLVALSSSLALNGMQQRWENPHATWESYDATCNMDDINNSRRNRKLLIAVLKNDIKQAREALDAGANVNATIAYDLQRRTLDAALDRRASEPGFFYSSFNIRNEALKDHGVEAGNTALHLAITFAHLDIRSREMIQLLLENNANLDIPNYQGISPLLLASVCSSSEKHSENARKIYGKIYESLTKLKNLEKQSAEGSDEYLNS